MVQLNKINSITASKFQPISPVKKPVKQPSAFTDTLKTASKKQATLTISKHAQKRLLDRGVYLSSAQWAVIGEKLEEARTKGVTDSLVILKNAALIASAKNHTVISVLNRDEASTQIFTNIDGAIFIENI